MLKCAALGLCLVFAVTAAAEAPTDPSLHIRKGMAFSKARKQLMRDGWRPEKPLNHPPYSAMEKALVNRGAWELESCAVDGAGCLFRYRRGKACLAITAQGETASSLMVGAWHFRCQGE